MAGEDRRPDGDARAEPPGQRRSASAADARRREAERIAAMTATERALLALDLGDRYAAWARKGER